MKKKILVLATCLLGIGYSSVYAQDMENKVIQTKESIPAVQTTPAHASTNKKETHYHKKMAKAVVISSKDAHVTGEVNFVSTQHHHMTGVMVTVNLSGLQPGTVHGFHVHEEGNCSSPDFSSAGGHFNPTHTPHGNPHSDMKHHHLGDMPNLTADSKGNIHKSFFVPYLSLDTMSPDSIIHRSIIIHAHADDYTTQPSGNSGDRIGCAIIHLT